MHEAENPAQYWHTRAPGWRALQAAQDSPYADFMRKNSGLVPSPWLQLFLAGLALMPWLVLVNNAISLKNTPAAAYPLAYSIHYQDR